MMEGVLIIDRIAVFRLGLAEIILQAIPGSFVYEASSMGQAMSTIHSVENIFLVLVDISLQGGDGRILIPKIRELISDVKIIVVSEVDDFLTVQSALDAGANGFISKTSEAQDLIEEIFVYLNDDLDFKCTHSKVMGDSVFDAEGKGGELRCSLSKKKYEIALLIKKGLSNKEISEMVFLSEGTVKNYISQIYEEISVSSRAQAVIKLNSIV